MNGHGDAYRNMEPQRAMLVCHARSRKPRRSAPWRPKARSAGRPPGFHRRPGAVCRAGRRKEKGTSIPNATCLGHGNHIHETPDHNHSQLSQLIGSHMPVPRFVSGASCFQVIASNLLGRLCVIPLLTSPLRLSSSSTLRPNSLRCLRGTRKLRGIPCRACTPRSSSSSLRERPVDHGPKVFLA